MFSSFFIRRPIFATVLSIFIMLAGLMAIKALSVEQFPEIVPPVVQVSANYPGASAEVVANTVASPLEQAINGVDDMIYMQSSSSGNGNLSLAVTFKIGTNPDQATINVNNRVQQALPQLPEEVRRQGVTVSKKSNAILQIIALTSPDDRFNTLFLSNYATLNIVDALKRVPGVGDVVNFAGQDYSMRIWLKPDQLAQLKLTPMDVQKAIKEQNSQFAAGKVGAEPTYNPTEFTYTLTTPGRFSDASQFENIIVRANPDGSVVRLKDVARVELGALSYDFVGRLNGKPTVPIGIYLAPGANQLATAHAVDEEMQKLAQAFPQGLSYTIPYNTTKFVEISIHEVYKTLGEAMVLVFLVVYLFLQNWRATLIPCLAVPVSIVGTFAGMYAMGFSINTLTLFGMVLSIGLVVDDAIVVLENVERIMREEKKPPFEATIQAMKEITGPVIAIVLVLCSVFIPVAFLGGIAGQMYKQFAITIAVSVIISGFVALTLTPALCALILKENHQEPNKFFRAFNNWFEKETNRYGNGVQFLIKRSGVAAVMLIAMLAVTAGLFKMVPPSLLPNEDQGYVLAAVNLPDGASLSRTAVAMDKLDKITLANPAVQNVLSFSGFDILSGGNKTNAGVSFVTLKPWDERKSESESSFAVARDIYMKGMGITEGFVMAFNPPPIMGMSTTGGFEGYLQSRSGATPVQMAAEVKRFIEAASKRPELAGLQTTFSASVPQIAVSVDRQKAKAYGVSINDVYDTMQSTFGSAYVNDFTKFGRVYKVQMQAEADFRSKISDLNNIFVRSQSGEMIPLSALVEVKMTTGPQTLEHFNVFPSAKIVGGPAPGYSSGQALAAMQEVAKQVLPSDYSLAWSGTAYQEQATGGSSLMVFGFGMLMVFLLLAAQYEKWSLPLAVITAVPFAVFGAFLFTWMRGLENDVYFQVALVTLIGLAAKNAILIVEFAVFNHEAGMSYFDSAILAAKQRYRPIIMTSLAFVFGCVPLALASGAGAASRHALGTAVIGGMLAATFIAVFFIPLFYLKVMQWTTRAKDTKVGQKMKAVKNEKGDSHD